jgi:hypothetical protein
MYQPKDDRPGTPGAILLWMGVCVVLMTLIVLILQGCAAGPKEAPLSRLAGANPNCVRNCSASLLTIENNRPGAGTFSPVMGTASTVTATNTDTDTTTRTRSK